MFNGLDNSVSKPVGMGGNCIDELGAAGGGVVIALDALLDELPRLRTLSHFSSLKYPRPLSILIQGFGAVGAHAARIFKEKLTDAVVIGISDVSGYLYDENGLPVEYLFQMWRERGVVARTYFAEQMAMDRLGAPLKMKYGSQPDDLLRESGFCLIPAAPIANYLDTDISSHPSMTIDRMGQWAVIVEGANTYSPDPTRRAARARMEREVYRERGVLIATDFLVNSGGVIFAAQEQLIKTPPELRIPDSMLGNRKEVERWLKDHSDGLQNLAAHRLQAAEVYRDEVIRRNMRELVDLLVADADLLPYEASERISIRRIASRESDRTASDIMENILTIGVDCPIRQAASKLVEAGSVILAVLNEKGALAGVVTDWDLTRAAAEGTPGNQAVETIMTREVVTSAPTEGILEMVRKLEYHDISALPVVDRGKVLGMVSADLLARGSLYRLLQSQLD
jgi:glutamate dehydrogenase (NAD(P)+)